MADGTPVRGEKEVLKSKDRETVEAIGRLTLTGLELTESQIPSVFPNCPSRQNLMQHH